MICPIVENAMEDESVKKEDTSAKLSMAEQKACASLKKSHRTSVPQDS